MYFNGDKFHSFRGFYDKSPKLNNARLLIFRDKQHISQYKGPKSHFIAKV